MQLRDIFRISKGTKVILAITFSVSVLAIVFAFFYYRSINNSEDPRIRKAREFLSEYDKHAGGVNSFNSFHLLDSADRIFRSLPDYKTSFETGIIYNNKSSALLLMAIYDSSISETEKKELLSLSLDYCDSSIANYNAWISDWDGLSPEAVESKIRQFMTKDDPLFFNSDFGKVLQRRVRNICSAQIETPRRLSVSFTNKGTIYRHMMKPDSALLFFQEALSLWDDNITAKSNMSVLLGGEPVRATLIQSLFPPDKNKK
jgi:tetratricopeptide (TPR) repeat protein